ncbi:MAG: hypothetical protein U0232_10965 [Thermomicrobiales bacterium]
MLQFVRRRAVLDVASFGALRSAAFAAFWPLIALTGTWMRALVQGYFVYEQTHDAFQTALVQVFQGLPVLVLSPLAGITADTSTGGCWRSSNLRQDSGAGGGDPECAGPVGGLACLPDGFLHRECVVVRLARAPLAGAESGAARAFAVGGGAECGAFNVSRIIGPALSGVLLVPLGVTGCFRGGVLSAVHRDAGDGVAARRSRAAERARAPAVRDAARGLAISGRTRRCGALLSIDLIPVMLGMTQGLLPVLAGEVLSR